MPVVTLPLPEGFDLLRIHNAAPGRYPFLLESVVHGTPQARFDLLLAFPGRRIVAEEGSEPFLNRLDRAWREHPCFGTRTPAGLPFAGGWFLYLGYELAGQIEPGLELPKEGPSLPIAMAVAMAGALIVDHQAGALHLVAEPGGETLIETMRADIAALAEEQEEDLSIEAGLEEDPPRRFLDGVERIRRYIREGDVFQVNLSRAWRGTLKRGDATALYRNLRRHNPAPFAALMRWDDKAVISSSPERLIEIRGDRIATRPIAGTRPRGRDERSDLDLSRTLMSHPKERAEHVMLIDLERNDLGRVCRPGTVEVDELMVLESYAHVHHIVSNVRGRLRPGVTPGEAIAATFPGGTITGCPKVRCMEIIAELEGCRRGPYTGSLGYLGHDGSMDLNILIRTLLLEGRDLTFRTGAGIVADSVPERELEETRAKARGLLRALGEM